MELGYSLIFYYSIEKNDTIANIFKLPGVTFLFSLFSVVPKWPHRIHCKIFPLTEVMVDLLSPSSGHFVGPLFPASVEYFLHKEGCGPLKPVWLYGS